MRFLIRTNPGEGNGNQRGLSNTGFEIPNSTITWVSLIYLFVNIIATSLSGYLSNKPQREIDKNNFQLKKQNFEVQLLQRVLEIDNIKDRKVSLQLLITAGLIEDNKNGELLSFIKDSSNYIPVWPKRNIETLNSYLNSQNTGYFPVGSSSLNAPTVPSSTGSLPRNVFDTGNYHDTSDKK